VNEPFPSAAPELPVNDLTQAAIYYEKCLGFHWDWGTDGIGQVTRGACRLFLTDGAFREGASPTAPVVIWINLDSKTEVDELHAAWNSNGARIVSAPESKPWNLHEFTAADLDGNLFRVFYDFAWELPDRGGRVDDAAERDAARARA
jgi:Glyoxalase/Bleomycin resistance protein/Dioxygenase superfamily